MRPVYAWRCGDCGHEFDSHNGPLECPVCGGWCQRVYTPPVVTYKGKGWAKKDRRREERR